MTKKWLVAVRTPTIAWKTKVYEFPSKGAAYGFVGEVEKISVSACADWAVSEVKNG